MMVERRTMVHVYRDQPAQRPRVGELIGVAIVVAVFVLPLVIGIVHGARHGFSGDDKGLIAWVLFMCSCGAWASSHHSRRDCFEIRLSDDGTCEFVTRRRVIRLHVAEIKAVDYEDGEGGESYTVRYGGGRIEMRTSIADFRGFLARLSALNPAVDLSSFPDHLRPAGVRPSPPGLLARWGARRAVPLTRIGSWGVILSVLVTVGLVSGLLPERFAWLLVVSGVVSVGCLVWVITSAGRPER